VATYDKQLKALTACKPNLVHLTT